MKIDRVQIRITYDIKTKEETLLDNTLMLELKNEQMTEIKLPLDVTALRLQVIGQQGILKFQKLEGQHTFAYDLHAACDNACLQEQIFVMDEMTCLNIFDFRFGTQKIIINAQWNPLLEGMAKQIQAHLATQIQDVKIQKEKLDYQRKVYDLKVAEVNRLEQDKVRLNEVIEDMKKERDFWEVNYHNMENSFSWKITAPLRNLKKKDKSIYKQLKVEWKNHKKKYGQKDAQKKIMALHTAREHHVLESKEEKDSIQISNDLKNGYTIVLLLKEANPVQIQKQIELFYQMDYEKKELFLLDLREDKQKEVNKMISWYQKRIKGITYFRPKDRKSFAHVVAQTLERVVYEHLLFLQEQDYVVPQLFLYLNQVIGENEKSLVFTDHFVYGDTIQDVISTAFKPDYSKEYFYAFDFIGRSFCASKQLWREIEWDFQEEENFFYESFLKMAEKCMPQHIQRALWYLKELKDEKEQAKQSEYTKKDRKCLLQKYFDERQKNYQIVQIPHTNVFRIQKKLDIKPLISIIIPNKDHVKDLKQCIDSILEKTTYPCYELIIVENNSQKKETFDYYETLKQQSNVKIVIYEKGFNYSAINNTAVESAAGEFLVFLNNDTQVITNEWLEIMLQEAQNPKIGVVGAKLLYPDNTIQHAGVILGIKGIAGHSHTGFAKEACGYMNRLIATQEVTAVTAACCMIRTAIFKKVQGFDETLAVAFNDVDFCLKVREAGYRNIWQADVYLYHDESKSRGIEDTKEKVIRFEKEIEIFQNKWKKQLKEGDAFYNPNLTLLEENFALRQEIL